MFVYQRDVCVYYGKLDGLKEEYLHHDDTLHVMSFFRDGVQDLAFEYTEKVGNMINVDCGKLIVFDHTYSIFSTTIRSAHSYKYTSELCDDEFFTEHDLQQHEFTFTPKRVDNRPKFDGALAMPAPNLIQNDVSATAHHGPEGVGYGKCGYGACGGRGFGCGRGRPTENYESGLQQNYENSVDGLKTEIHIDYLADGSEVIY